ncbi:hypothetical protein N8266_02300 [Amylibacter sp.]|nr:hypothetical protein [Amylibacter sp.]
MQLNKKFWLDESISSQGFDPKLIKKLCVSLPSKYQVKLELTRHFPFRFWQSKVNGYGTAWRSCLNLKKIEPLMISADHGIAYASELSKFEYDANCPHIVFDLDRYLALVERYGEKRILRVKNPFVAYAEDNSIKLKKGSKGTLVFVPHSLKAYDHYEYDWDAYFKQIISLPEIYHPITFCVHYHDVLKGLHLKILEKGFNVVTLGHTTSNFFIDRFYDLVTNFEYATSSNGGSDLLYCEFLGVKYFEYGEELLTNYKSYIAIADNFEDKLLQKLRNNKATLFQFPPEPNNAKVAFVHKSIGLDGKHCIEYDSLRKLNRINILKNPTSLIKVFLRYIFGLLSRRLHIWFG